MNLIQLRTEVLGHGFDPNVFNARINNYLNDAYMLVCRRVDYYIDEATQTLQTTSGSATFPLPANFARVRSLDNTDLNIELTAVNLRDIDRSSASNGIPYFYAIDGQNIHLYPTPDASTYNLRLRYWLLPALLVNDTDIPTLPVDWHHMLWEYAVAQCYRSEDDMNTGAQWEQKFAQTLAMFTADQRFISSDVPNQVRGMWDQNPSLRPSGGWSIYGWNW